MKKIRYCSLALITALLFLPVSEIRGTINSVALTLENPTTLSNGLGYYLAGKTYTFTVQVLDPDITGWAGLSNVGIVIANTANIVININPSGTGSDLPVTVASGSVNAVADVSGNYNNCTVSFKVTFRWDTPASVWASGRSVTATATTTNTRTDQRQMSYGVCSSIKVLNMAADGVAADGMVNPWHDAFHVTGVIVYDVPGAGTADRLVSVVPGEIAGAQQLLYVDGNLTGLSDGDNAPDGVDFTVTSGFCNTLLPILGDHSLRVRVPMATAGATVAASNNITLKCDRVQVTGITFFNGGGIDAPAYYRSVNHPGTQVRLNARMQNGGGALIGNTVLMVRNVTEGTDFPVTIANGQMTGVANVPNPTVATVPAGTTVLNTYRIQAITGGASGGDTSPAGQSDETRIAQPASPQIYWDNADPPGGTAGPFTAWLGLSQTAFSLTFNWAPLTAGGPDFDGDFYTYRVYYREVGTAPWLIIDRTTAGFSALGTINTGTVSITNLRPVTNYDYYITAVDVFGNEVLPANYLYFREGPPPPPDNGTASTVASTVLVSITDGIAKYSDEHFDSDRKSTARPLRKTSIRVSMFIVGVGYLPDVVNIIGIPNVADPMTDGKIIDAGVLTGTEGVDYYRYGSQKVGANQWNGYISDSSPLIQEGANSAFILELIRGGVKSYVDHNSEGESAPGNPNDYEWTFSISSSPTFTPWPTRVLNNVITDRNPMAYPSFYLSDDAYVTIKAYDIKGRALDTLLDGAFRKGGQNIKEGGWGGSNRSGKRLGPGLYYLNIKAKRASDGRIILDAKEKVVVAR